MGTPGTARLRIGLLLVAIVFATGVTAALAADGALAPPTPTVVPPVPPATPPGAVVPPAGRRLVPAPIERVDVRILESFPPRYVAGIVAGLPNGCAQKGTHSLSRSGSVVTVTVQNAMPLGEAICTMIYGTYELSVDLGSDFRSGETYTLVVNDHRTTFRAQ